MSSHIKIYTLAHKRPDFIVLQHESLLKNMTGDYEYVVLNNAAAVNDPQQHDINRICTDRGIRVINVEHDRDLINEYDTVNRERKFMVFEKQYGKYQTANVACAYPLVWAQKHIFSQADHHVAVIDSDMFLIGQENFSEAVVPYDFMFIPYQTQHVYFPWNAIFLINKDCPDRHQINWWCGMSEGVPVDVGGMSSTYLKQHPQLKIGLIRQQYIQDNPDLKFHPSDYELIRLAEDREQTILHYRSGSNWNRRSIEYHQEKTEWLKKQLK